MRVAVLLLVGLSVALACGSTSAEEFVGKGVAAAEKGDWQKAITFYDKAIKRDAGFATAYSNRARAEIELGDFEASIRDAEKALELLPELLPELEGALLPAYTRRWDAQIGDAHPDGPISEYEKVSKLLPGSLTEVNRHVAPAYIARAERVLLMLAAQEPRAFTQADMGRIESVMTDLETARGLDPGVSGLVAPPLSRALHLRGRARYSMAFRAGYTNAVPNDAAGMRAAIADYDSALALTPLGGEIYYDRGVIDAALNDRKAAQGDFLKAIELGQREARHYFQAGLAFWSSRDGDLRTAVDYFNKAIEVDPTYAFAYEYRGRSYALFGDCRAFLADWNKAKALTTDISRLAYYKDYEDRNVYGCFR